MDAASPDARALASWITTTDPRLWEMEGDHCHYHGSPKLSFSKHCYRLGIGLFSGARDKDMLHPRAALFRSVADLNLLQEAIKVVEENGYRMAGERAEAQRKRMLARAEAQRKRVMDRVMDKVR